MNGYWWKAWVLLTGLSATVLGWMTFPPDEQPPASGLGIAGVDVGRGCTCPPRRANRSDQTSANRHSHVAGDAAEAGVSGPGDTYATLLTAMLHEHRFRAMNTDVGVWLWSTAPERAVIVGRSLEWAEAIFGRVEHELSRFRSASGVSRLNQAGGRGPQPVSPLLWTVLMSALDAADDSGGHLRDGTPCIGPLRLRREM